MKFPSLEINVVIYLNFMYRVYDYPDTRKKLDAIQFFFEYYFCFRTSVYNKITSIIEELGFFHRFETM
jgi:hypothetical protein